MTVVAQDGRRGLGTLLRDIAEGSTTLVRDEVRLARMEAADALTASARGAALTGFGAVLALLGVLSLVTGVILLIGDQWLPRDWYWLGALIVVVIAGGGAAWFAARGRSLLAPEELVPDETLTSLKRTRDDLVSAVKR